MWNAMPAPIPPVRERIQPKIRLGKKTARRAAFGTVATWPSAKIALAMKSPAPTSAPKIDESVQTSSYETPLGDSDDDAVSIPPLTVRVPQSSAPSARSTQRTNTPRPADGC